jgi:hypothetical protein
MPRIVQYSKGDLDARRRLTLVDSFKGAVDIHLSADVVG